MILVRHELRRGKISFLIWTGAISFMIAVCIFLYPEMKGEMQEMTDMFSSMGSFTAAFGMDRLNFGSLIGYYGIECGNVLGLGGAFFASLCAVTVLCKEEKDKTADFLLTHPVTRSRVITEKLVAVLIQVTALNLIVCAVAVGSIAAIGETISWKSMILLHIAYFLMHLELAGVCFGISAFLTKGSIGVGLGVAALMYFLNLIANITDSVKFLKYITPFGYCDSADIVTNGKLDGGMIAIGAAIFAAGIAAAYWQYTKKDIA